MIPYILKYDMVIFLCYAFTEKFGFNLKAWYICVHFLAAFYNTHILGDKIYVKLTA